MEELAKMLGEKIKSTSQANTTKLTATVTGLGYRQKFLNPSILVSGNRFLRQQWQENTSEQGLTLLECLVAIGVIAVVVTAFTPQIFLAVATQVQNRRAEQAIQLAQGEVDRVRRTVELGNYSNTDLPPIGSGNPIAQQSAPRNPPERLQPNQRYPSDANAGALIDVNGDGTNDFIVQTYRNPGISRDARTVAFDLGVRVYAFTSELGRLESPPQQAASLKLTSALGQQQQRPLAIIYTSVAQSDNRNSLCKLREFRENNTNNAGCQ